MKLSPALRFSCRRSCRVERPGEGRRRGQFTFCPLRELENGEFFLGKKVNCPLHSPSTLRPRSALIPVERLAFFEEIRPRVGLAERFFSASLPIEKSAGSTPSATISQVTGTDTVAPFLARDE